MRAKARDGVGRLLISLDPMGRAHWACLTVLLTALGAACSDGGSDTAAAGATGGSGAATGGGGVGGTHTGGTGLGSGGGAGCDAAAGGVAGAGGTGGGGGSALIGLGGDGILQIWTVGDSITEGVNNGYRNEIWTVLTGASYPLDFVGTLVHPWPDTAICPDADHDGHSGYTIGGILGEIDGWYGQIAAPDVVLVMAGTNDIAWWVASGTEMSQVADDMMGLVDHMLAFDADLAVIVGTIPPESSTIVQTINRDRAELVTEYNQALTTDVTAHALYGTRLWVADVNGALTVADLSDGIHPTRQAHDKVGDAWLAVLQPLLVPPP
jgi:acyl-CoA thioesterase I